MKTNCRLHRIWPVALFLAAAALAMGLPPGLASAAPPRQPPPPPDRPTFESNEFCLACHETPGRLRRLPSGEWLALAVDPQIVKDSAHADTACVGCHTLQSSLPHEVPLQSRRDLMLKVSAACAECHQEEHEGYEEGVHGVSQDLGVVRAASCVDCHSGHAVQPLDEWSESEQAARCGACHEGANAAFVLAGAGHQNSVLAHMVERLLVVLTAAVIGVGFLHVELDALRWVTDRLWGRHRRRTR